MSQIQNPQTGRKCPILAGTGNEGTPIPAAKALVPTPVEPDFDWSARSRPMATAETIATAFGGCKAGGGWTARCPAHDDRTPSLSIRDTDDGKVLVRCHTGCDQDKVIATLQSRGLWPEKGSRRITLLAPRSVSKRTEPDRDDAKRTEAALAIWQVAMPAGGSLVETYLGSRGLHLPPTPALRFHARLTHHPGAFGRR